MSSSSNMSTDNMSEAKGVQFSPMPSVISTDGNLRNPPDGTYIFDAMTAHAAKTDREELERLRDRLGTSVEDRASALEVCPSEALLPWDEDDQALADGRSVETQHRTNEARRKLVDAVAGVRATDREEIARATVRAVVADLRLAVETMRRTADALEKAAEYIEEEALERIVGAVSTDAASTPTEGT